MVAAAAALIVIASAAAAQTPSRGQRAAVASVSLGYVGAALFGAHIAIRDSLPEAPFGMRSLRSVRSEFLVGTGTALSPGLSMLVAQGVAAALLAGPSSTARGASTALAIGGVLYGVGQLSEPITW